MTNCKNCTIEINETDNFCKECGAKIIKERITIKSLFSNFLTALGWDSNFFITLRHLLYKPQVVFKEYINGTRKKYANPFTFFAISLAISLFVFSQFSEQLIHMSTNINLQQTETSEIATLSNAENINNKEIFGYKSQEDFREAITTFFLKYYNLSSFLLLPLYTLIAFFVFKKPYNYGEHLVINAYLQSVTVLFGLLLFVFSLLSGSNLYATGSTIFSFLFYSYAYKKLYNLSLAKLFIKILKLIGISLLIFITLVIIGVIVAIFKDKILT